MDPSTPLFSASLARRLPGDRSTFPPSPATPCPVLASARPKGKSVLFETPARRPTGGDRSLFLKASQGPRGHLEEEVTRLEGDLARVEEANARLREKLERVERERDMAVKGKEAVEKKLGEKVKKLEKEVQTMRGQNEEMKGEIREREFVADEATKALHKLVCSLSRM